MYTFVTKLRFTHWLLLAAGLCVVVWPIWAGAQFNPEINYQGKLADSAGSTVANGDYDMVFRLYDAASGGSLVWDESRTGANQVTVTDGLFSVMLGEIDTLSGVDFDQTLYLSVEVESDGEMTPRKVLGAVPAAFQAQEADNAGTVGGVASTSLLRSDQADTMEATESSTLLTVTQNGTGDILNLFDGASEVFTVLDGGNVGIGENSPSSLLHLSGGVGSAELRIDADSNNSGEDNVPRILLTADGELNDGAFGLAGSAGTAYTGALANAVYLASDTGGAGEALQLVTQETARLTITAGGDVGIGTTSPGSRLTVAGDAYITGALRDSSNSAGTNGMVLQTTSSGTQWVATSTLGIGGGGSADFVGLSDTQGSLTANRLIFANSGGSALTDSADLTFDGTTLSAPAFDATSTTLLSQNGTRVFWLDSTPDSIAIGEGAGNAFNDTGSRNTALGYQAAFDSGSTTASNYLTAVGYQSAYENTGDDLTAHGYRSAYKNTGVNVTAIGLNSAYQNSGARLNAVGYNAGYLNTANNVTAQGTFAAGNNTGLNLVAQGYRAGEFNSGANVTTQGYYSARDNTGSNVVAVGYYSARDNAGDRLTAVGFEAGYQNSADNLTVVGAEASRYRSAPNSTIMGYRAGYGQPTTRATTSNNLILGYQSGYSIDTGADNNILLGYQAADNLTTGANNIVIGYDVEAPSNTASNQLNIGNLIFGTGIDGTGTTLSSGNIGIGTSSPSSKLTVAGDAYITGAFYDSTNSAGTDGFVLQTTGTSTQWVATSTLGIGGGGASDFVGLSDTQSSLTANRLIFTNSGGSALTDSADLTFDGSRLVLDGDGELEINDRLTHFASSGVKMIIGRESWRGINDIGADSIVIGDRGLTDITTGSGNIVIGRGGDTLTTGSFNTITGAAFTGSNLTTGGSNTFYGYGQAFALEDGNSNSLFGMQAGNQLRSGSSNTFSGYRAGYFLATSSESVLVGRHAGEGTANYEAQRLTIVGSDAGESLETGADNNVLFGYRAGQVMTTGTNNLLLGYQAADNVTTGANNIVIGYDVDAPSATGDNQLNIGNLLFGTGIDGTGTTLSSGNIGIGTSTPSSLLTLERTGLDGEVTGGITQNYEFVNSGTSELVYGNEMTIVNNPSSANALAGSIIKVEDNTSLANTVRGIEVQADGGTNTQGENTALSGFARTFGVRGVTRGDAGGTFEPAGVYGATQGTTQGNALRGFSDTITTADMMSLLQDSSSFSGAGLLMNFGTGGGSYSGNFLDLQVNGATQFSVSATGTVSIAGALLDSSGSAGTSGQILESTATGTQWVTGGGGGGSSTFLGLSDTPSSFTAGRIPFTNGAANALTDSANLTFASDLLSVNGTISVNDGTAGNELFGLGAFSSSASSTVLGNGAGVSDGNGAYVVLGEGASANGFGNGVVIGQGASITSGAGVTVVGQDSTAGANQATVIGQESSVGGARGIALGQGNQAAQDAVAIGQGLFANTGEIHIGNAATAGFSPDLVLMGATGVSSFRSPFRVNTSWLDSTDGTRRSQAELIVENSSGSQTFLQADATASGVDSFFLGGDVAIGTTSKETLLTVDGITTTNQLNIGGRGMLFDDNSGGNGSILIGRKLDFDDTIDGAAAGGGDNLAIGSVALDSLTTGAGNIAIGEGGTNGPARSITSGSNNIVIGATFAGTDITTGNNNSIFGSRSAFALKTGSGNSLYGYEAGHEFRSGDNNTFIGEDSGFNLATSTDSTLIGQNAGQGTSDFSASRLTVLGSGAGASLSTGGDENIFLGYQAGDNVTTGARNLIFGYDIDAPSATGDNQLNIGNLIYGTSIDGTGTTMSSGNVGIGNTSPALKLHIGDSSVTDGDDLLRLEDANSVCDFNADTGTPSCGSDRTLKTDISTIDGELDTILALEPSYWRWKSDDSNDPLKSGFIAQEVEEVLPELVTESVWVDGSTKKFLNIGGMMPYVVGAIKEMWETITLHDERIADLENENEALQDRLEALEAAVQSGGTANVSGSTGGSIADDDSTDTSSAGDDTSSSTDTETDTEPTDDGVEDDTTVPETEATTTDETDDTATDEAAVTDPADSEAGESVIEDADDEVEEEESDVSAEGESAVTDEAETDSVPEEESSTEEAEETADSAMGTTEEKSSVEEKDNTAGDTDEESPATQSGAVNEEGDNDSSGQDAEESGDGVTG